MRFNADDRLLSLNVVSENTYLLVATSGGYAKRTAIEEYTRRAAAARASRPFSTTRSAAGWWVP